MRNKIPRGASVKRSEWNRKSRTGRIRRECPWVFEGKKNQKDEKARKKTKEALKDTGKGAAGAVRGIAQIGEKGKPL